MHPYYLFLREMLKERHVTAMLRSVTMVFY